MVRFDERFLFFQGERVALLANVYKESEEKGRLDHGIFAVRSNDLRVMLLGDSKLYGAGVRPECVAARRLKEKLGAVTPGKDQVHVLDLTRPGNNTYNNWEAFDHYVTSFAPNVVILAYNHNDVYGRMKSTRGPDPAGSATSLPASVEATKLERTRSLRRLLFSLRAVSFAMVKLNMELKLGGVVLPGTEFDHLLSRSHHPEFAGWRDSRRYLESLTQTCHASQARLILYLVPELEMLPHYKVFGPLDGTLVNYCADLGVECVNGVEPFLKRGRGTYALSRHDGHPNEAAHEIMAEHLFNVIRSRQDLR